MRIACRWFLTDLAGGGAEQIPLRLASKMARTDLTVVLLKNRIEHALPLGGPDVVALSRGVPSLLTSAPAILARGVKIARGADVLVAGLEWAPTFFTVVCGAIARKPVIATVHVDLHQYRELEPVPAGWWFGMKLALSRCRAVVVVSEDVQQSVRDLGVDPGRIHVIPNPGHAYAPPRTTGQGVLRLLTVASLHPRKGLDIAIRAAAKLRDERFDWVILGDGSERDRLIRLAHEVGVADRIKFVGFKKDPTRFYAGADLYVLPSRMEGLPLALIEALSAGLPIVATECGSGVSNIVRPDIGGLVPAEDPDALAAAIRTLILDQRRREACGVAARKRAREFDPGIVAHRYEALLRSVVASGAK